MQINDTTLIIPRSERRSYPPLPRFLFPCFVCALFSLCHPLHWIRGSSVCALPVMSLQCIIFQKLQILPIPVIFNLFGTTSNSVHSAHNQFSKIANFANFSYFQPFGKNAHSAHSAHNQFSKIANFANFSYFQPFGITPIAPARSAHNQFSKLVRSLWLRAVSAQTPRDWLSDFNSWDKHSLWVFGVS